jgi:hypothetical protein
MLIKLMKPLGTVCDDAKADLEMTSLFHFYNPILSCLYHAVYILHM